MHVKKGDTVQVIAGKDKGKVGEVTLVLPRLSRVVVTGVNIRTKHIKAKAEGESGQIMTAEASIHSSNVMLYSKKEKVASRVAFTFTEDGRKVRKLKKRAKSSINPTLPKHPDLTQSRTELGHTHGTYSS
ncbi:MAG: 50S ribosomal protein L24 [Synechococcales cyanobacterium RU_4_20]|nr:50S ribosomal protein L24 [Synechococcales cyanobacterium RU_4_20]